MAKAPSGKTPAPSQAPDTTTKPAAQKQGAAGKLVLTEGIKRDIAFERVLAILDGRVPCGVEKHLVRAIVECHHSGDFDDRLPMESSLDAVVTEYALKHGRADVVMFHADGTATVIEAKDGSKGYGHVVAGIGQCSLYAAQIAGKNGAVRATQRALAWTSTRCHSADAAIEDACHLAGVIPLPYPSMEMLMATRVAATAVVLQSMENKEAEHGRS